MEAPAASDSTAAARAAPPLEWRTIARGAVTLGLLAVAIGVLPAIVGADWITTFTSVAIYSVAALGFGILYGRVGMISLGQVALLTVGCWVGTRLAYATSLPFPLLLLAAGAITCAIGTLVGLPALRLSGLYLALITLMFAGATTVVLSAIDFPNGGGGFKGRSLTGELTTSTPPVRRPSMATADTAYYRYTVVVCALLFLLALLHVSGKPGRAWASIRESEPAAHWRSGSTSPSTSSGRSRSHPSSPASPAACSQPRWESLGRSPSRPRTRSSWPRRR